MEKKKKLGTTPSHYTTVPKKLSGQEKESEAARLSQIYRHRTSSHDVSGFEPGDEDSATDLTKSEFLAFKASFSRPKYANTYRMEPYRTFEAHIIRKKAEEILKNILQDYQYDGSNAAAKCLILSEDILAAVKDQDFDRYKYIVQVFMVEKSGQSIHIASRWVWDATRDNWVSALYETENYVTVALIIAAYYE
ncbi:dynein light chain Tctex-type protein 2 [Eublepharis macularius]|uniref:Dynein light chain Tctex-type protein 2 n=1 Tax=Eublepharis macularius TaxID=481883 RepID=A0AA97LI76_EUBMA|nr:dynein light chain Tctex-type protein 2 [Eublepharis macularius]